jgi:putative hydrolase of the HAD superfamily
MVLTYKQMVPNPKPAIEKEVYSIGDSVFAQPTKNIPQVETALAQLKPHYDMVLVTKGDHEIQHWRLTQSGLKDFFEAVHVVDHKDVPLYKQIIEHHKFEPAATCSIGDSLKSDILTAMAVGTAGIWIPNNNWADFEHAEPPTDQPHFKQIPHLTQLRSTLENW